jgi:hypothetical protein
MTKDCRPPQPKTGISSFEAAGVMTRGIDPSPEHRGQGHRQRPRRLKSGLVARRLVGLILPNCCRLTNAEFASTSVSLERAIPHSITQIRQPVTGLPDRLLTAMRPPSRLSMLEPAPQAGRSLRERRFGCGLPLARARCRHDDLVAPVSIPLIRSKTGTSSTAASACLPPCKPILGPRSPHLNTPSDGPTTTVSL